MKTNFKLSLALSSLLLFSGCGSDDDDNNNDEVVNENSGVSNVEIDGDKTLFFYNSNTGKQFTFETNSSKWNNLNSDENSSFYTLDKEAGKMFYWADQPAETIDEKIVMLKENYDFETDGNLTYENFLYLGHFHDSELASHSPSEFSPENIVEAKEKALIRLNTYFSHQLEIRDEISEAMEDENQTLCNFFVPTHEHDEEEHEEEAIPHYAISETGIVYVFEEGENGLEKVGYVPLNGVSECSKNESGMTSSGEGVFVFSGETQKLYLVDSHDDGDYHEHSNWSLSELIPNFEATQMIGFGSGEHAHEY
jgi:hypothetical protein